MVTEIIKGCIAILVIGGAIISLTIGDGNAQEFLIPLAGFAFGYYFKQVVEQPLTRRIAKMRGK